MTHDPSPSARRTRTLPARASLEHLKKEAKQRLKSLRRQNPQAGLAAVQFALTDIFHVPLDVATGVALVAHAVSFVPISVIGFAFFAASPLKRGELRPLPETAPREP